MLCESKICGHAAKDRPHHATHSLILRVFLELIIEHLLIRVFLIASTVSVPEHLETRRSLEVFEGLQILQRVVRFYVRVCFLVGELICGQLLRSIQNLMVINEV
jgi:hypothetical protein